MSNIWCLSCREKLGISVKNSKKNRNKKLFSENKVLHYHSFMQITWNSVRRVWELYLSNVLNVISDGEEIHWIYSQSQTWYRAKTLTKVHWLQEWRRRCCKIFVSKSWCPAACCKAFVLSLLNTIKTRAVISFIRIQTRAAHSVRVNDSNSEISCSKSSSSLDKEMLMLSLMPLFWLSNFNRNWK